MKHARRIRRDIQLIDAEIAVLENSDLAPKIKCARRNELETRRLKLVISQLKKEKSDDR